MKITFFIGHMGRGGSERVISIIANDYAERGWNVDIVLLLKNEVIHKLHDNVRIVPLVGQFPSYIKNAFFWIREIRRYVRKEQPDRVVSFIGRINALVLTATLGMKIPVVVSERNDPKHDGRGKVMLWYCNKIYRRAKAIVFQNRYEQSCFDSTLKSKGYIVPNPVQVSAIKGQEPTEQVIATAGRLNYQKNHFMLIDAMEIVHKTHPQVKCRIYGEGELRTVLQEYINRKGLGAVVSLEGNHSDIHEKLAICSLFVLTSEFEGQSNALIEAMMIGLPCISTDYEGASEIIHDGCNGIVVKRADYRQLADKIHMMMSNDTKAGQLAKAAIETTNDYKAAIVLERWHQVID